MMIEDMEFECPDIGWGTAHETEDGSFCFFLVVGEPDGVGREVYFTDKELKQMVARIEDLVY
jgi:hypothetical protein